MQETTEGHRTNILMLERDRLLGCLAVAGVASKRHSEAKLSECRSPTNAKMDTSIGLQDSFTRTHFCDTVRMIGM